MRKTIIIVIAIVFHFNSNAQIDRYSINLDMGQTKFGYSNFSEGYIDPDDNSLGRMIITFQSSYALKLGINKYISKNDKFMASVMVNYWRTGIYKTTTRNEEDQTKLGFLYGGTELHFLPSLPKTKWKADIGIGLYTKILGNSSNKDFDPKNHTKLIQSNNTPKSSSFLINSIWGIGYFSTKFSYKLHYHFGLNRVLQISTFKGKPLTQGFLGISYNLGKRTKEKALDKEL